MVCLACIGFDSCAWAIATSKSFPFHRFPPGFKRRDYYFCLAQPLNHSTWHLCAPCFFEMQIHGTQTGQMTSTGFPDDQCGSTCSRHTPQWPSVQNVLWWLYICVHAQVLHTHIYAIERYMYCVHSYIYLARYGGGGGGGEVKSLVKRLRNKSSRRSKEIQRD